MTTPAPDRAAAVLDGLLKAEAEALMRSDFAALSALVDEKHRLMNGIAGCDGRTLERLRARLARNARLFEAAMQGLRGALDRIETLASGPAGLKTYDRAGRMVAAATPEPRLIRRA